MPNGKNAELAEEIRPKGNLRLIYATIHFLIHVEKERGSVEKAKTMTFKAPL